MILNGTSVRGIYLYADNIEFERGDFVVDDDCLYICLAEDPTNLENNTVSGIKPSEDVSCLNYKIYPGDKISTVDEYYDFINEGGEDKYISSATLCKILENSYFGVGDSGVIKDFVFYDSLNDRVNYSVKSVKEAIDNYAAGGRRVLNEILVKEDLNNGTLKVSSNLIDLKDLLPDSKEDPIIPSYPNSSLSAPLLTTTDQLCGSFLETPVYSTNADSDSHVSLLEGGNVYSVGVREYETTTLRSVSGLITNTSGDPISGAKVSIKYGGNVIGETTTTTTGYYKIGLASDKTSFVIEITAVGYQMRTDTITVPSGGGRSGLNYSLEKDIMTEFWTIHVVEFGTDIGISRAKLENTTTGEVYPTTMSRGYISFLPSISISVGDNIDVSAVGYLRSLYSVTTQDIVTRTITIPLSKSERIFHASGIVKARNTESAISGAILYNSTTGSRVITGKTGEFSGLTCFVGDTVQVSATRFVTEESWLMSPDFNTVSLKPVTINGEVISSVPLTNITISNTKTGESVVLSSETSFTLGLSKGIAFGDIIKCEVAGFIPQTKEVTQRILDGEEELEFELTQAQTIITITTVDYYTGNVLSGVKVVNTNTYVEKLTGADGQVSFELSDAVEGDTFEFKITNYKEKRVTLNSSGTVDIILSERSGTVFDTSNNVLSGVAITNVTHPTLSAVSNSSGRYSIPAYSGDTLKYEKSGYITQTQLSPGFPLSYPHIFLIEGHIVTVKDDLVGVAIPDVYWLDTTTAQYGYTNNQGEFNPPTAPSNVVLKHENYVERILSIEETTEFLEMSKKLSTGTVIDSVTGNSLHARLEYKTLRDKVGAIIYTETNSLSGKFSIKFYAGEVLVVSSDGYVNKEVMVSEEVTSDVIISLDKQVSTNGGFVYNKLDYPSTKLPIPDAYIEVSRSNIETAIETYWTNSGTDGSFLFGFTGIKYGDEIKANKAGYVGCSRTITTESDPDLDNIILLLEKANQDWSLCEERTQSPISIGYITNVTTGTIVSDISPTGGFTIDVSEGDELSITADGYQTRELTVTGDLIAEKVIYLNRNLEEFTVSDKLTEKVLEGALIVVVGDISRSTYSDSDGKFSLLLRENETIQVSLSGYETEKIVFTQSIVHRIKLQKIKSSGYVYDSSTGSPLIGVLVENSNSHVESTYTNSDGYFEIPVYEDDTLTFSAEHYQPQSIPITTTTTITIPPVYLIRQTIGFVGDSIIGRGVPFATVTYGTNSDITDSNGFFSGLNIVQGGLLKITANEYRETSYTVDDVDNVKIFIEKIKACLKVIDDISEEPIVGCEIFYKDLKDREGNIISATPREEGLYTITAYSDVENKIIVRANGYEDKNCLASEFTSSWTAETDTQVPQNNLIRLLKGSNTIAVRDSILASYLSGATIIDTVYGTEAIPDAIGYYKIRLYEDSILSVSKAGYEDQKIPYASLVDSGFVVDLIKEETCGLVVVNEDEVPIAGAVVTNTSVSSLAPVTCNEFGEFSINTWKGDILSAVATGYKTESYIVQNEVESSIVIRLEKEDIVEVTVSGTVSDLVTGAKISGAEILIKNSSIRTISDSNGDFLISLPTFGVFTFLVSHENYETLSSDLYIPPTGKNDVVFELRSKEDPPEPTKVTVTGYVYDNKTLVGIPNVKVLLSREIEIATVYTNNEGYYEIVDVDAPSNYQFDITKSGYKSHTSTNTITPSSTSKSFYLDPEEPLPPDDRPIVQRGDVFILRQYTYVDTVRGDGNRFRVQELVDPYYGDIHFRYARSNEQEGSKTFTYSIVSNWRSVFETSLSILDKLSAISNHYNNKCIELENTKAALESRFCYKELDLDIYRAEDGSILIPFAAFSGKFSTTFPVTFTIKQVIDSGSKIYKASSVTVDLSDVIDSREEIYKINEDLLMTVAYSNNIISIVASSNYDVIFKSAYYKQSYIPENE